MEGNGLRTPFGNTMILGILILWLLGVAQAQFNPRTCCLNTQAFLCFGDCVSNPASVLGCLDDCDCIQVSREQACPPDFPSISPLQNSAGATINEFCKLGCASSVCNVPISTFQNSDSGEEVVKNKAVEQCTNACSAFCTEGSTSELEIA